MATGTATVEPLTLDGTANGSTAHADARAFAFDANGRLIMTTGRRRLCPDEPTRT